MNRNLLRRAGIVSVGIALGSGGVVAADAQMAPRAVAGKISEPTRATPAMLQTVSPTAKASLVSVKGSQVRVNAEQLSAYNALPEAAKLKLGPAVGGKVLSAAELKNVINSHSYSTVMCPW